MPFRNTQTTAGRNNHWPSDPGDGHCRKNKLDIQSGRLVVSASDVNISECSDAGHVSGMAVIVGSGGGIGGALQAELERDKSYALVVGLSRTTDLAVDLLSETSIEVAARHLAQLNCPLRLLVVATGFLHDGQSRPERSLKDLSAEHLARSYAVNAIGPALVLKHFAPLLPREGRSVIAAISAKVGSIGDNHLGGWHSYRASKAALNQIIRTAAVELKRTRPEAVCVALHPGTVDTRLSAPFSKAGLSVRPPAEAARDLLQVIDGLRSADTGGFFDYRGEPLPW